MQTHMTLPLFAYQHGHQQAQVCLEQTRSQVEQSWPEQAEIALKQYVTELKAAGKTLFTSEVAIYRCYETGLERAHDDRAWGALFAKLARQKIITKSDQIYQRSRGHGSPAFKWETA